MDHNTLEPCIWYFDAIKRYWHFGFYSGLCNTQDAGGYTVKSYHKKLGYMTVSCLDFGMLVLDGREAHTDVYSMGCV